MISQNKKKAQETGWKRGRDKWAGKTPCQIFMRLFPKKILKKHNSQGTVHKILELF
jgi:hypothetical protein